jgi:hypothetical protein
MEKIKAYYQDNFIHTQLNNDYIYSNDVLTYNYLDTSEPCYIFKNDLGKTRPDKSGKISESIYVPRTLSRDMKMKKKTDNTYSVNRATYQTLKSANRLVVMSFLWMLEIKNKPLYVQSDDDAVYIHCSAECYNETDSSPGYCHNVLLEKKRQEIDRILVEHSNNFDRHDRSAIKKFRKSECVFGSVYVTCLGRGHPENHVSKEYFLGSQVCDSPVSFMNYSKLGLNNARLWARVRELKTFLSLQVSMNLNFTEESLRSDSTRIDGMRFRKSLKTIDEALDVFLANVSIRQNPLYEHEKYKENASKLILAMWIRFFNITYFANEIIETISLFYLDKFVFDKQDVAFFRAKAKEDPILINGVPYQIYAKKRIQEKNAKEAQSSDQQPPPKIVPPVVKPPVIIPPIIKPPLIIPEIVITQHFEEHAVVYTNTEYKDKREFRIRLLTKQEAYNYVIRIRSYIYNKWLKSLKIGYCIIQKCHVKKKLKKNKVRFSLSIESKQKRRCMRGVSMIFTVSEMGDVFFIPVFYLIYYSFSDLCRLTN